MRMLPKPEIVITHESDLDGLLAGLLCQRLARHLYQAAVPLQSIHNHQWRQRPLPEQNAWVCDLAFDRRCDRPGWVVVDHHPTEVTPEHATLIHDPGKSAALLCYELCREQGLDSPSLDRLVHLSNVADLFLEDDPDFLLATDYANLVKTYQFWNLHDLIEGDPERLLDHPLLEVMAVRRKVEDPLGLAWSRRRVIGLAPAVGLVHTVIGNTNSIVHRLLEGGATPYTVLVTLFRRGSGSMLVSLRSRTGEAAKIAARLQGGGHANAAGAILPRSIQTLPDAVRYLRQILNPDQQLAAEPASLEELFESSERPA